MAMGLAPVNFQVGDPADFVAIDATTLRSAIADAPMARRTFTAGRLVASANQQTTIHH
jgi:cytosine/adenosine deaminase-related metal-dependent hydrolase